MNEVRKRMMETPEWEDDWSPEVAMLAMKTGEHLEILFGPVLAERSMQDLYDDQIAVTVPDDEQATGWRDLWERFGAPHAGLLTFSNQISGLCDFGMFGLPLPLPLYGVEATRDNLAIIIEEQVVKFRQFLDNVPKSWPETPTVERVVLAAEARLLLDTGRDVTPEQLAAIARVSPKSIRNLLTPRSGTTALRNRDGRISNTDARQWLEVRPDFKTSIWWHEDDVFGSPSSSTAEEDLGRVVFVPVSRDGSWFDPLTCRNARGFSIGSKGHEEAVEDYWDALERLSRMPRPSWRRPNDAGNWGVVTATAWKRMTVAEIEARVSNAGGE